MNKVRTIVMIAGFCLAASSAVCAGPNVDKVFINGKIITVDDQFAIEQAIAVKDGRIYRVGSNAAITTIAGPNTEVVDLQGKSVIPGLIDTHSHLVRAAQLWDYEVRLDGITRRTQALARLKAKGQELQPGDWLLNFGGWVEEQFLDDPRGFTLKELDDIAPENPVFLDVNYSHRYVNSAFLKLMGIPVDSTTAGKANQAAVVQSGAMQNKAITEAMVVRDEQGRATGRINGGGNAFRQVFANFPVLDRQQTRAGIKSVVTSALSRGLTTIYDGGGFGIRWETYEIAGEMAMENELDMRIFHTKFMRPNTPAEAREESAKLTMLRPDYSNDRHALIGLGEVIYGPHHDGFDRVMDASAENMEGLKTMFTAAVGGSFNVQMHMVQPQTMHLALDLMDELSTSYSLKPLRWIFIHADMINQSVLDRMRNFGMSPSFRSNSLIGGAARQALLDEFGEDILSMPNLRMAQNSGIPWTFGSEAPRINVLNPLMSLAWAVTGQRFYDGAVVNNRPVSREEALIAHTRNGALAIFQENNLGQIRSGFQADFVVLDRDYLEVAEEQLFQVQAEMTVVAGDIVYRALP